MVSYSLSRSLVCLLICLSNLITQRRLGSMSLEHSTSKARQRLSKIICKRIANQSLLSWDMRFSERSGKPPGNLTWRQCKHFAMAKLKACKSKYNVTKNGWIHSSSKGYWSMLTWQGARIWSKTLTQASINYVEWGAVVFQVVKSRGLQLRELWLRDLRF